MVGCQMEGYGVNVALPGKTEDDPNFLPPFICLPFGSEEVSFVFVADDAFTLKQNLMKSYPQAGLTDMQRVYYRRSRARRISENLFGIIANCWCVFRSTILLPPETIEILKLAT